jgi:DNA-binding NarL/FixJ family response regulator
LHRTIFRAFYGSAGERVAMELKILTILVVPKTLLREGLVSLLSGTNYKPDISVSCMHDLARERKAKLEQGPVQACKLFILSRDALTKPGSDTLLPELTSLRREHPGCRVLVLCDSFDFADAMAALRAGANGYLINTLTVDALVKSLDLVMLGETVLSSEFAQAVSDDSKRLPNIVLPPAETLSLLRLEAEDLLWDTAEPLSMPMIDDDDFMPCQQADPDEARQLSRRETAILRRLIQGDSNKRIAREIGVAEATVKTHIKAILRKIRVKNRTQAAMWAYTNLREMHEAEIHVGASNGNGLAKHAKNGSN